MNTSEYCLELAAPPGSSCYYATLFLDPTTRRGVCTLLALREEIHRVLLSVDDTDATRTTLQWWAQQTAELGREPPTHPVFVELSRAIDRFGFDVRPLVTAAAAASATASVPAAVRARRLILSGDNPCGGIWTTLCAVCNGFDTDSWVRLGSAYTRLEYLQRMPRLLEGGENLQQRVPMEDIATESLLTVLAEVDTVLGGGDTDPKSGRNARILDTSLRLTGRALARKMRRRVDRIGAEPQGLSPLYKLWMAWRARRAVERTR